MNYRKHIMVVGAFFAIILWPLATPMGETTKSSSQHKEPIFAELEPGEESFDGIIKDEGKEIAVTQLTFFGHPWVAGVCSDDDDSSRTTLDLENIKSIKIVAKAYISKHHKDNEFTKIEKVATSGIVSNDYLMPRNIVICGIEKSTGDKKAWELNNIDEIIVTGKTPGSFKLPKKAKGFVEKPIAVTKEEYVDKKLEVVEKKTE